MLRASGTNHHPSADLHHRVWVGGLRLQGWPGRGDQSGAGDKKRMPGGKGSDRNRQAYEGGMANLVGRERLNLAKAPADVIRRALV